VHRCARAALESGRDPSAQRIMLTAVEILGVTFVVVAAALAVIAILDAQRLRWKYYRMRQRGCDHGFILPEDLGR
jgi:hypothetical protein